MPNAPFVVMINISPFLFLKAGDICSYLNLNLKRNGLDVAANGIVTRMHVSSSGGKWKVPDSTRLDAIVNEINTRLSRVSHRVTEVWYLTGKMSNLYVYTNS